MSATIGKLLVCDRCGETLFLTDSIYFFEYEWKSYDNLGMLCPKCSKEYESLVDEFMNWKVVEVGDDDWIKPDYVTIEKRGKDIRYIINSEQKNKE